MNTTIIITVIIIILIIILDSNNTVVEFDLFSGGTSFVYTLKEQFQSLI